MERRNRYKIRAGILAVILIAAGVCGCGSTRHSGVKKLSVITEPWHKDIVETVANSIMESDATIKIEVQALPEREEDREIQIQKLRTRIMAGEGPDVYLLSADRLDIIEEEIRSPLFENPYKTMQSGALASLDRYMKQDEYWKDNTYKEAFLKEGQYHGRQYILPLSCSYFVQPRERKEDGWKFPLNMFNAGGCFFQPAADYEKKEVLFDKEKWKDFVLAFGAFLKNDMRLTDDTEGYLIDDVSTVPEEFVSEKEIFPDIEGRKMAYVRVYGAIGMSGNDKKEAYDFLMRFIRNGDNMNGICDGSIPLREDLTGPNAFYTREDVAELKKMFRELDGIYFVTEAERFLCSWTKNKMDRYIWGRESEEEGSLEKAVNEVAEKAWNQYHMMVLE